MFLIFRRRSFMMIIAFCVILLGVSCFVIFHSDPLTAPTLSWQMAEKTFLIDPGHGGTFPGRVNDQVLEKNINLAIAAKLNQFLQESGAVTIMTRTEDIDLIPEDSKDEKLLLQQRADLEQRVQMAQDEEADLFISIHCNSIPNDKWTGAQTFYNAEDPESKKLALSIQNRLMGQLKNTEREALPRADTYLFRNATIPTVIVECGFLSNVEETNLLCSEEYQEQLAWAIYLGISDYLAAEE